MDVIHADGMVYKRATTTAERRQLAREARALRSVAHPGVVRLLRVEGADPPSALVLEALPGGALARGAMPAGAVARLGSALAVTLSDLHGIGWVHGSLRPDHVLLDSEGYPVLCGFGSAVQREEVRDWSRLRQQDLADLAQLISSLLAPGEGDGLRRALDRPRSCQRLAAELRAYDPVRGPVRRRRRLTVIALCAPVGLGLVMAPLLLALPRSTAKSIPCPGVDRGCGEVSWPVQGNLRLIAANQSVVVMGRWRCGPQAFPAVLNPATGAVWSFDAWPSPGRPVHASFRAQVPGATGLRVRPQRSGCDRIEVDRGGRPPVVLASVGPG